MIMPGFITNTDKLLIQIVSQGAICFIRICAHRFIQGKITCIENQWCEPTNQSVLYVFAGLLPYSGTFVSCNVKTDIVACMALLAAFRSLGFNVEMGIVLLVLADQSPPHTLCCSCINKHVFLIAQAARYYLCT